MPEEISPTNLANFMEGGTGNVSNDNQLDTTKVVNQITNEEKAKTDANIEYYAGTSLDYMCKSCAKFHADDDNIIRALFLSYASVFVENCNGINVEITGSAGSGKTHIIKTALKHIPDKSKIKAKLSDKALYYHGISTGTVLAYDDQDLSEDMQSTIKNLSWDEFVELLTVKQQTKLSLKIPPRCPYWNTKVEGCGDEQIQDRVIKFWADESDEHKKRRDDMENKYLENPKLLEGSNYSADVSKKIWGKYRNDSGELIKYTVIVPFASRIKGGDGDARTRNLFISMIQASCVLHVQNRETSPEGYIIATEDDFAEAERIVNPLMKNIGGSQSLKLNRNAKKVLDVLSTKDSGTIAYEFLMKWCGLSKVQLTQAINGRKEDGMDGLVSKCPAISTVKLTTYKQDSYVTDPSKNTETYLKHTTSRNGIIWNKEMYKDWIEGNLVFYLLDGDTQEPQPFTKDEEDYLYDKFIQGC